MDKATWMAIIANCRRAGGFLKTVDWRELAVCAEEHGTDSDRRLIEVMRDAATKLPEGHH